MTSSSGFVSRGGDKLAFALDRFGVDVRGLVCADLGSHVGGFVDCLLQRGAARVYSVDTCYGTLAWTLRRNPRVVVMERSNAIHMTLPEPVDLATIDVGWTPQAKVLPAVRAALKSGGRVVTLIKPHYEAGPALLTGGVLPDEAVAGVVESVLVQLESTGWRVVDRAPSPLRGHGGNAEWLALLTPKSIE